MDGVGSERLPRTARNVCPGTLVSMRQDPSAPSLRMWCLGGALLGLLALGLLHAGCGEPAPFVEVEWTKPWAPKEDVALWQAEWERRAKQWTEVPDPPGVGPVERARYWLARGSYELEVRRRGDNFVLVTYGVDAQEYGGGWSAFGEGRIEGAESGFAGTTATFIWSCLGIRYRTASDGVSRLTFSEDGSTLSAVYVAHEAPTLWFKAYGKRQDGEPRPALGTVRGQIPFSPAMTRLAEDREYVVPVMVVDETGAPLQEARVGIKGVASTRQSTNELGLAIVRFMGRDAPVAQTFVAGRRGHRSGTYVHLAEDLPFPGSPGPLPVTIVCQRLDLEDHANYEWVHPAPDSHPDDAMACGTCHTWQFDEWVGSRHARMADNGLVAFVAKQQAEHAPDAPDDCRGCHQPASIKEGDTTLYRPRGVMAGAHCDFCHKVSHVSDVRESGALGALGLSRPDPEVLSRPGAIQHAFGSVPDATYAWMGASYNPLYAASHYCGGCHQGGGRWREGVPAKLDTFEEWRKWAAGEAQSGRSAASCQDCHMRSGTTVDKEGDVLDQLAWDALHRSKEVVHSHRFQGREPAFAARALDLQIEKRHDAENDEWEITVSITNTGAGHRIPTGTWTKHVVVGVWAKRGDTWLPLLGGDQVTLVNPAEEPPVEVGLAAGDYRNPAGLVLGVRAPDSMVPWLRPAFYGPWSPESLEDTRLQPRETRTAVCRFPAGGTDEEPTVEVRVVHRRSDMGAGLAQVPYSIRPNDAPPAVRWMRVVK